MSWLLFGCRLVVAQSLIFQAFRGKSNQQPENCMRLWERMFFFIYKTIPLYILLSLVVGC